MKPSDIYAMPDKYVYAWHENYWHDACGNLFEDCFGVSRRQVQASSASSQGDQRVHYREKSSFYRDADYNGSVFALTLDGQPYGIYVAMNGDHRYESQFLVTDRDLHDEAVRHVRKWCLPRELGQTIGADQDLSQFGMLGNNARFVPTEDGPRLVDASHVTWDGTLVFDRERFSNAFDDFVDGVLKADPQAPDKHDVTMRWLDEAAEAIRQAIPVNLRSLVVNEHVDRNSPARPLTWNAVVVETEHATYAVGVMADEIRRSSLAWQDAMKVQRIGGPKLFEEYREKYGHEAGVPSP